MREGVCVCVWEVLHLWFVCVCAGIQFVCVCVSTEGQQVMLIVYIVLMSHVSLSSTTKDFLVCFLQTAFLENMTLGFHIHTLS